VGKYTQTWPLPYGDTTCVHWVDLMAEQQRFVMAADMLLTLHRSDLPGAPIPPDRQIQTLQSAIHEVCAAEAYQLGMNVTEIAATLYVMANDLKP